MTPTTTTEQPRDQEKFEAFTRVWDAPKGLYGKLKTINNIPIAKRYIAAGFSFFLIGGFFALLMRTQLAVPENDFLDAETYNQIFTMHGTTMMFLFVIPFIEALANYFMPLQLGTRDLPFPRLTALAFWTYVFGGAFLFTSFLFGAAPAGGWFAYPPLVSHEFMPGIGMDFWDIGLSVAEVAAMGAAAEIIVAILRMRAPGMSLDRMPIFAWAMLVTGFMIIFAFTPLIVGTAMLEFDRKGLTSFFNVDAGGEPLLWQHLFWVFGHPEVYIMFIPAIGIVTHVVQVFARRPIVSYTLVVLAIIATAFISFGLWVHHMFTTGLSYAAMGFFAAASMMIAIPSGIQVFTWIATLWTGRPRWRTPLLFVIGFIFLFVAGGLTGVMVGSVPFDLQAHDSYFVVGHFHYVLIGGVVFPLYAGLYYWLPKMTGRLLSEPLGKWNFWVMFIGFNVAFFPMHISGLLGMPRRIYTYEPGLGWDLWNMISTVGAFVFAAGALLLVANFLWSLKFGKNAGVNPWDADSLEWSQDSPPPNAQFPKTPVVRGRHPLWRQDSLEPRDARTRKLLEPLDTAPGRWRGGLVVSVLDGRPLGIVHLPGPTITPFLMAVGFTLLFAGALLENVWLLAAGGAVALGAAIAWFRPRETEEMAVEEIGLDASAEKLPLAVSGPNSNGWWGMIVLDIILATALVTLVASYFYLGEGPAQWPPRVPELMLPLWATGALLAAGGCTVWFGRAVRGGRRGAKRLALALAFGLVVAFMALTFAAWQGSGIVPRESAYGSAVIGLLAFQWIVTLLFLIFLGLSQLWAWKDPEDPRGHATTLNSTLIGSFAVLSWVAVFATVYLTPRVW